MRISLLFSRGLAILTATLRQRRQNWRNLRPWKLSKSLHTFERSLENSTLTRGFASKMTAPLLQRLAERDRGIVWRIFLWTVSFSQFLHLSEERISSLGLHRPFRWSNEVGLCTALGEHTASKSCVTWADDLACIRTSPCPMDLLPQIQVIAETLFSELFAMGLRYKMILDGSTLKLLDSPLCRLLIKILMAWHALIQHATAPQKSLYPQHHGGHGLCGCQNLLPQTSGHPLPSWSTQPPFSYKRY